jgi:hypothetical protein
MRIAAVADGALAVVEVQEQLPKQEEEVRAAARQLYIG